MREQKCWNFCYASQFHGSMPTARQTSNFYSASCFFFVRGRGKKREKRWGTKPSRADDMINTRNDSLRILFLQVYISLRALRGFRSAEVNHVRQPRRLIKTVLVPSLVIAVIVIRTRLDAKTYYWRCSRARELRSGACSYNKPHMHIHSRTSIQKCSILSCLYTNVHIHIANVGNRQNFGEY